MAISVGSSLTGAIFPIVNSSIGPFKSAAGNYYAATFATTNYTRDTWRINKSPNPITGAWASRGGNNFASTSTTTWEAASVVQVADVLHVALQTSTGAVNYRAYDMAADAFVAAMVVAYAAAVAAPTAGYPFVSLVPRSTGELVCCFAYGAASSTSSLQRIAFKRRATDGTWANNAGSTTASAATFIDSGGSVNWSNPLAVLGADNRVHCFFKDHSSGAVYQRTLSEANALEAFPASFDTTASADIHPFGPGTSFGSGGVTKVRVPYRDSNDQTSEAALDSADVPTVSSTANVSGAATFALNNQAVHAMATHGATQHLLYSDSATQDLWRDQNTGTGWGADVEEWDAATINALSANVYDRSGAKLAMVVNDGGSVKSAEISVVAVPIGFTATVIGE